jgi:hypothetical protein
MVSKRKNENILNSKMASDIFNRRLIKKKTIKRTSIHTTTKFLGGNEAPNKFDDPSNLDNIYILIDLTNVDLDNQKLIDFKNYLLSYINL